MGKIYSASAVPLAVLTALRKNGHGKSETVTVLDNFSVSVSKGFEASGKIRTIAAVLRKILTRGKLTIVSEYEEEILAQYAGLNRNSINYVQDGSNLSIEWKKFVSYVNLLHKLRIAITEGLYNGLIDFGLRPEISIKIDPVKFGCSEDDVKFIVDTVLKENFGTMFDYLSMGYGFGKYFSELAVYVNDGTYHEGAVLITTDGIMDSVPTVSLVGVEDNADNNSNVYFDLTVEESSYKFEDVDEEVLTFFLTYLFRKKHFREGQFESIKNILIGNDTLVLLPTGSGKSVVFQLAGFLTPGTSMVICPLVSLIEDQMDNLSRFGIDNVIGIINSGGGDRKTAIMDFERGFPVFVYVSPEKFLTKDFRESIAKFKSTKLLSSVVIDEAHCCSEWGHDFRTSYLNIGKTSRKVCSNDGMKIRFVALTGTASNSVLKDMRRELSITEYGNVITPKSFERKELDFRIINCKSSRKFEVLKGIFDNELPGILNCTKDELDKVNGLSTLGGVVFCPHSSGEVGVDDVNRKINSLGVGSKSFGGKKPDGKNDKDWEKEKLAVTQSFKDNEFSTLVATKGFGMGIDKPNIRYTVHYGLPNSIESFYQEAGRAGRDGKRAYNFLIVSNDDPERTEKLLDLSTSPSEINAIISKVGFGGADDVTRALWFHYRSFKGIPEELKYVEKLLPELGFMDGTTVKLTVEASERTSYEKAVRRLLILGIIEDYTFDFAKNEYEFLKGVGTINDFVSNYLDYVNGYNPAKSYAEGLKTDKIKMLPDLLEGLKRLSGLLVRFVYDTIEKGRRRAIKETLGLSECTRTEDVSAKIIKYLEGSKNDLLDRIVSEKDIRFVSLKEVVDGYELDGMAYGGIVSQKEAEKMNGYVSRYLEGYPDNPQLLILRGLTESLSRKPDLKKIVEDITLAMKFSKSKYGIPADVYIKAVVWALVKTEAVSENVTRSVIVKLVDKSEDLRFVRGLIISELDKKALTYPYAYYFASLAKMFTNILSEGGKDVF